MAIWPIFITRRASFIPTARSRPAKTMLRTSALRFSRRGLASAARPALKPSSPKFSSGPCAKRPGYTLEGLADAPLGRSHRAKVGKAKLGAAISETKSMLVGAGLPEDYHIGIVPGSDTGAVEMAMWSMLGPKPVTVVHFESFGSDWFTDVTKQLKLANVTNLKGEYGQLPPLDTIDWDTDVVFTANGTTSGVRVPETVILITLHIYGPRDFFFASCQKR